MSNCRLSARGSQPTTTTTNVAGSIMSLKNSAAAMAAQQYRRQFSGVPTAASGHHHHHHHQRALESAPPPYSEDEPVDGSGGETAGYIPTNPFDPVNQLKVTVFPKFSGTPNEFATAHSTAASRDPLQYSHPPASLLNAVTNQLGSNVKVVDPHSLRERPIGTGERFVILSISHGDWQAKNATHPVAIGLEGVNGSVSTHAPGEGVVNKHHQMDRNPLMIVMPSGASATSQSNNNVVYEMPESRRRLLMSWGAHGAESLAGDVSWLTDNKTAVIPWKTSDDGVDTGKVPMQLLIEEKVENGEASEQLAGAYANHYDRIELQQQMGKSLDTSETFVLPATEARKLIAEAKQMSTEVPTRSFGDPLTFYAVHPHGMAFNDGDDTGLAPSAVETANQRKVVYQGPMHITLGIAAHVRPHADIEQLPPAMD